MAQQGMGNRSGGSRQVQGILSAPQPQTPWKAGYGQGAGVLKPGASNGNQSYKQPARAAAPRNITPSTPAPAPRRGGGGGGTTFTPFGGNGSVNGFTPDASAMSAPAASDDDYLAGDSSYQAQLSALLKALSDGEAENIQQKTRYETDYGNSLKGLGWTQDNPATAQNEGAWNMEDQTTASGRAFNNQRNDFASRGLLQSSLFADANSDLTRGFNDQLGSINQGRSTFMDDLARSLSGQKSENNLAQQQARAEALARRASGVSLV